MPLTSTAGAMTLNSRASRAIWRRSERSALAAPGYWILTATSVPSCHVARCTWPMDAAAAGTSSNDRRTARASRRRAPASSTRCTTPGGIGGAASCSLVRVSRYGPAISSGSAASKMLIACPNFIAPPLSWPSTLKIWSAVRRWTSSSTASAGAPPRRRADAQRRAAGESDRQRRELHAPRKGAAGQRLAGARPCRRAHPLRIVGGGRSGGRKQSAGAPVVERDGPGDAGVVRRARPRAPARRYAGATRRRGRGPRRRPRRRPT